MVFRTHSPPGNCIYFPVYNALWQLSSVSRHRIVVGVFFCFLSLRRSVYAVMSAIAKKSADAGHKTGSVNFVGLQKIFQEQLEVAFETNSVKQLKAEYDRLKHNNDSDKKPALDQTFRELLLFKLIEDVDRVGKLIALSVEAAREDMVSTTIPVVLLGDAFDAVTLEKCEQIFAFVEDKVAVWKEEVFFTACKNNLLRMCNDLLRRLSRSQNTVFCGRILLFLAKFFPFSERSGLNIISEFNLDNITEYGADGKDMGEALADTMEDMPVQIDYNLYCKFWSLQDYFRNPNQCYNKVQWKTFSSHGSSILSAFSSFKLEEQRTSSSSSQSKRRAADVAAMEVDEYFTRPQHFFAKFLTNPKLLALQLSDSNFRRSVLVQFLILFQYLNSTVKFKAESFNLTTSQSEYIKETETQVYKLIEETPPEGKKFAKTVRHMLLREELWNNWKNDGCKEFKRPEVPAEDSGKSPPKKAKRALGEYVMESNRQGKFYMANNELTRLWNLCPDNLQACKGDDRNFLPPLETYLENPREKNDPSFEWRALRLLARQSPHFFTLFNAPSYRVADYLESVRKKIQKDKIEVKVEPNEGTSAAEPSVEHESVALEEQDDPELLKTEQLTPDDKNTHKSNPATKENIAEISAKIGADWKKLGKKLGYSADELLYFETENPTTAAQCKAMLSIWFDDDDDASLDNLAYILEGLEMNVAAAAVKRIIDPPNKMEDISD